MAQVLRLLPQQQEHDPRLLVGHSTFDDAGVYELSPELALVQTVDYFTPVVDNPYDWGRIAAANALSDIYAMGATPITALNLLNFPVGSLDLAIAADVLRGGLDKIREAGAVLLGGHSVQDDEPKYGLAVTGIVDPRRIVTNAGARPGDSLVLTKPIGVGIVTTGLKRGLLSPEGAARVTELMATLNRGAAAAMTAVGASACTDVTGFGLLGHIWEMARASCAGVVIDSDTVPVLAEAWPLLEAGAVPGGSRANQRHLDEQGAVEYAGSIDDAARAILTDANTSGGLVIAVREARLGELLDLLAQHGTLARSVIGRVVADHPGRIRVI